MKAKSINIDRQKQEITQNIPGYPVTCYLNRFSQKTYDYIDWHWHIEFQLCLVTKGTVSWYIGAKCYTASEGEGIFINSQQVHMAKSASTKEASFFCVDFRPDFLCSDKRSSTYAKYILPVLEDSGLSAKVLCVQRPPEACVLDRLRNMAECFVRKEEGYEPELAGNVFLIWKELSPILRLETSTEKKSENTRLKEIMMYLHQNYSSPITLDEIAKEVDLSRGECCRYFKKHTGQTIFEFLIQYRIRKSLEMLLSTDFSLAQIAAEVGFSNQSYYTSKFKGIMGMTPGEYRKAQKNTKE